MNAKYPVIISIFSLGLITAAQGANFAVIKEQMDVDMTVENYRSDHQKSSSLDRVLESDVDAGDYTGDYKWASTDERVQKISYSKGKNRNFWSGGQRRRSTSRMSPLSF
ncbi:hypothetical protein X471_01109 [Bartonella bacilliformis str. Heidi Mejia]|uniref:hypothetical protein n=1 Tax=Bartonella bacilliformis TaxID=774 RepID=UPI00044BC9D0|nr:hypothetical protein [Bartonella bacilliformis]EYS90975.1 hypothetical protein X471_01109 [Bartonella bacilliformis str. Heidi Mejia]EYS95716.1 hypothetical protein X470_00306 [Bartonella bacilliformis Peru-18]KEG15957.1 hypothetical protein H709_01074 [Bartonella bacilliformis CUSCO5]KEG17857.1 hypothetical protein H707_01082 [Bartonella bacilliformis Hosp800-02]KEG19387.1 hypothetical protein H704_01100 [Bartonella bacilliformis Peru38]